MRPGVGLERARKLAETARSVYSQIKDACEGEAARWEWGTFVLHSLEPAYFEVHKVRRGELLEREPETPVSGIHGCGFNAGGELVIERQLTEFIGRYYETFYRYEPDGTARFHFGYDPEKPWINASWLARNEAGHVRSIDTVYARGNAISEIYEYDSDGRVIGVERQGANPPYGDIHDFRDIEYDALGKIARVYWRYPNGQRVLHFERPAKDRTFLALREGLNVGLLEAIHEGLKCLSVDEPVYALAIYYCGAEYQHRLPPNVAIGLDSERKQFVESYGADAADVIWNPAEWSNFVELPLNEQLFSQCASANQDIWQNDLQKEADAFVTRLAQQLAKQRLPITCTNDFVVYAVNLDKVG